MITTSVEAIARFFGAEAMASWPEEPRLNVSPTQTVPVVVATEEGRALVPMRWGFLPHWYKSPVDRPLIINARAETIAEKPAFSRAVRERRCLFPADGFYEWRVEDGRKVAYVIGPVEPGPIAFAGIWQDWNGTPTCAIVTCAANGRLSALHERMPVVVAREDWGLWLGEEGHGAAGLMAPAPDEMLGFAPADDQRRAVLARRSA